MIRLRSRIASIALRTYLRSPHARRGNFVVSGYPKSGTTWMTQLSAALTGMDYRQGDIQFRTKGVVLHTHSTAFVGRDNILYAVRDPRESICSAARAQLAAAKPGVIDNTGRITDDFIHYALNQLPGARLPMRDHLQACIDRGWCFLRFEDLKADAQAALRRTADQLGWPVSDGDIAAAVGAFDFNLQKERNKGNAFFAQSALSSWKGLLSPTALDLLEQAVAPQAQAFGYDLSNRPKGKFEPCELW